MPAYSSFALLSDSLRNQTTAIEAYSRNIANIGTVGYKRVDVRFQEVLSKSSSFNKIISSRGLAGAEPTPRFSNTQEGTLQQTDSPLDVALNGEAFFVTQTERDNVIDNDTTQENYQLTDAGSFARKQVLNANGDEVTALVDLGGNYVLGYQYDLENRKFKDAQTLGDLKPIILQNDSIQRAALATKNVDVRFILNPTAQVGDPEAVQRFSFNIFDGAISTRRADELAASDYKQTINVVASKIDEHKWSLNYSTPNGTVTSADQIITFDNTGKILDPKTFNLQVQWNPDSTKPALELNQSVLLGMFDVNEFVSSDDTVYFNADGFQDSSLKTVYFNKLGELIANYDSGQEIPFGKLGIVNVQNSSALIAVTNTHFGFSNLTGKYRLIDPAKSTTINIKPANIENSNVDLTTQFTDLLSQQRSYQSVSSALNTINELYQLAINLYR